MLTIRRAMREDAPAVLRLIEALADFEQLAPPDADARARFLRDGWPETKDAPRFQAWLAHVRDTDDAAATPAAYAITFETYSSFLARPTLYLEDLFVLPAFRRQSIGSAFLKHLFAYARERDCGRMEWVCLDWNTGAQEFYRQWEARHLTEWQVFRKEVGSRG